MDQHHHHLYLSTSTAPPTPSMTDGYTHSDLSTVSSHMSGLLQQKLQERRRELRRERQIAGQISPDRSSGDEIEDPLRVSKGSKGSRMSKRSSARESEAAGRRAASMHARKGMMTPMGAREQEEFVSKMDKQNFDLKLRIYHQDVTIKELDRSLQEKTEDNNELMRLVDDQQRELDKREASLKEAVDTILLLQDKVRHLEKQTRRLASAQSESARARARRNRLDVASETEELHEAPSRSSLDTRSTTKDRPPSSAQHGSCSTHGSERGEKESPSPARPAQASPPRALQVTDRTSLTVPFQEELDHIGQDLHGLRARTMSVLSRTTDGSHANATIDRLMARSPAMSVLSEADFASVYNFRDEPVARRPARRYSTDLSDVLGHSDSPQRSPHLSGDEAAFDDKDTLLPEAEAEHAFQALDLGASIHSTGSAPARARLLPNLPMSRHAQLPADDLDVSNAFSRRAPTGNGHVNGNGDGALQATLAALSMLERRRSDSQLSVSASVTHESPASATHTNIDAATTQQRRRPELPHRNTLNNTPSRTRDFRHETSNLHSQSNGARDPSDALAAPETPAKRPPRRLPGHFDTYGFLDSQPTTPQLLYRASPQKRATRGTPPPQQQQQPQQARPTSLSLKDQQILQYISTQRYNEWIQPGSRPRPALAGPMFDGADGDNGASQAQAVSPIKRRHNGAARRTSGLSPLKTSARPMYPITSDGSPQQQQQPSSGARVFLAHDAASRGDGAVDDGAGDGAGEGSSWLAGDTEGSDAVPDPPLFATRAAHDSTMRALGLARAATAEAASSAALSPRKTVNFQPVTAIPPIATTSTAAATTTSTAPTSASTSAPSQPATQPATQPTSTRDHPKPPPRHPPVSLSAATSRRFAGLMRRRGSNERGAGSNAAAVAALAGSGAGAGAGGAQDSTGSAKAGADTSAAGVDGSESALSGSLASWEDAAVDTGRDEEAVVETSAAPGNVVVPPGSGQRRASFGGLKRVLRR